jgi:hypothetical protein
MTGEQVKQAAAEIDSLLHADWSAHGLRPNPLATDGHLVRRLYLDLVGRIPTLDETRAFLEDRSPERQSKLIDTLLASEGHTLHFFHWWADLLRVFNGSGVAGICGDEYRLFILDQIRSGTPFDVLVRRLVTASGAVWDDPAIGFYMRDRGAPLDHSALVTRVFLGTRTECAQCHNHPFDKWTQMQFYQNASYTMGHDEYLNPNPTLASARDRLRDMEAKDGFPLHRGERIGLSRIELPLANSSYTWERHTPPRLPHDYQYSDAVPKAPVQPAPLMGTAPDLGKFPRSTDAYAAWLTSPDNPRFTKAIANRMWKKTFGRGLIEPVDEMTDDTVPVNPPLMAALERLMISVHYDLRALQRVLFNTSAYQSAVSTQEVSPGDEWHCTGPLLSRLTAEQVWDSWLTLVRTDVDAADEVTRLKAVSKNVIRRKLDAGYKLMSADELYAAVQKAAPVQEAQNAKVQAIQNELNALRVQRKRDPVRERELGLRFQTETLGYLKCLAESFSIPAVRRLAEKVKTENPNLTVPEAPDIPLDAMTDQNAVLTAYNLIPIAGYDLPDVKSVEQNMRASIAQEADMLKLGPQERSAYIAYRLKMQQTGLFRAAELGSPAPPGHPLREFGQSDREVVDNASTEASIPQALLMMNSAIVGDILHPQSVLMRRVSAAGSFTSQVEMIYLTLLSRPPTPGEMMAIERNGITSAEDVIHALLTTATFLHKQ